MSNNRNQNQPQHWNQQPSQNTGNRSSNNSGNPHNVQRNNNVSSKLQNQVNNDLRGLFNQSPSNNQSRTQGNQSANNKQSRRMTNHLEQCSLQGNSSITTAHAKSTTIDDYGTIDDISKMSETSANFGVVDLDELGSLLKGEKVREYIIVHEILSKPKGMSKR